MILINGQIFRSARSTLLNSESTAWRFRLMLRSAKWTKPTLAICAQAAVEMTAVGAEADIKNGLRDVRFRGRSGTCLSWLLLPAALSALIK